MIEVVIIEEDMAEDLMEAATRNHMTVDMVVTEGDMVEEVIKEEIIMKEVIENIKIMMIIETETINQEVDMRNHKANHQLKKKQAS